MSEKPPSEHMLLETKNHYPVVREQEEYTRLSMHVVSQLIGKIQSPTVYEELQEYIKRFRVKLEEEEITSVGVSLTVLQYRVMEGILYGFTQTNYKGNITPISKREAEKQIFEGVAPSNYMNNINALPRIRVSQSQVIRWAGVNENSRAEKERALEALEYLQLSRYYFYYKRMAVDENNKPIKDPKSKSGYKMETVRAVDVLFNVKVVTDDITDEFLYYEITPSAIFLDQLDNYFLLVPVKWQEEVYSITGKNPKSYTVKFLMYLRQQFELKRRSYVSKHIPIEKRIYMKEVKWDTICQLLSMPETVYKRNKSRAEAILQECYDIALKAGYLKEVRRSGDLETYIMDELKYPQPKGLLMEYDGSREGEGSEPDDAVE